MLYLIISICLGVTIAGFLCIIYMISINVQLGERLVALENKVNKLNIPPDIPDKDVLQSNGDILNWRSLIIGH